MDNVSGNNLKVSMIKLFNKVKFEKYFPGFIRKADVSTIYKGKGENCNLDNDRGISIVSIFKSMIMELIYKDIYSVIDYSMSDL